RRANNFTPEICGRDGRATSCMKTERAPWGIAILISSCVLFCMSLWFSASAVVPLLANEWHLSESQSSFLTLSVQFGFVAGTLLSALLNLSDIFRPRILIAFSGLLAAGCNASIRFCAHLEPAIVLRLLTGFFL